MRRDAAASQIADNGVQQMKKLILPLTLALLGFAGFANTASAQRYPEREVEGAYDGPRVSVDLDRGRDWDRDRDRDRGGRSAYDLDRLNREVRIMREEIRAAGGGGRRVRAMYSQVLRSTDRLNFEYRRGAIRGWEVRRRGDEIRSRLSVIRRELRFRGVR
jgi:Ni/Co efflux regulator RcnB